MSLVIYSCSLYLSHRRVSYTTYWIITVWPRHIRMLISIQSANPLSLSVPTGCLFDSELCSAYEICVNGKTLIQHNLLTLKSHCAHVIFFKYKKQTINVRYIKFSRRKISGNCPVNLRRLMQELVRHFNGALLAVVVMLLLPARVVWNCMAPADLGSSHRQMSWWQGAVSVATLAPYCDSLPASGGGWGNYSMLTRIAASLQLTQSLAFFVSLTGRCYEF